MFETVVSKVPKFLSKLPAILPNKDKQTTLSVFQLSRSYRTSGVIFSQNLKQLTPQSIVSQVCFRSLEIKNAVPYHHAFSQSTSRSPSRRMRTIIDEPNDNRLLPMWLISRTYADVLVTRRGKLQLESENVLLFWV